MPASWAPLQPHGLATRDVPLLVAGSPRLYEGSRLVRAQRPPSGLRRCCQHLPFSGVFLPGTRRASPVSIQPFPACCRHYPAGSDRGISQDFHGRFCLRQDLRGSAPRVSSHEAYTAFVTYGPQGRSPTCRRVCQEAPPPAFACEASPQLHGFGSYHVGTLTHWVVSSSLVTPEPDVKLSPHPALTLQPQARSRVATGQRAFGPAARCVPASALTLVLGFETFFGVSVAPMLRGPH
jgi:hypothetical protein